MVDDLTRWELKFTMLRKPITQEEMAREFGRSQAWISDVVNGHTDPTQDQRKVFVRILDRDEVELFPELTQGIPA